MTFEGKATKLNLKDFKSPQMRAFWISSFSFFMCFFAWFGIVPFLPQVIKDLGMTQGQKYTSLIVAVSGTVFARLLLGKLCDRYGPRLCYTWLLIIGSLPVIAIAFVQNYTQFLVCRGLIGCIGASFVITQYHTSIMFAPNCVGTANATSAGWGNLGGGANRLGMPLIASIVLACGVAEGSEWRWSMGIAGVICMLAGFLYYFFTQDAPEGNFKDLKAAGKLPMPSKEEGGFMAACKDYRCWVLFLVYAGCFGIELTVYGSMDSYLRSTFGLEQKTAGYLVLGFALMNIFARTLGGYCGDRFGLKGGLKGRVRFLVMIMVIEGIVLMTFSQLTYFPVAFAVLILFSLSVQMAEGATFTVVPFINKKCMGSIAGIVGAGGNVGAVLAGLLLKSNAGPAADAAIAKAQAAGLSEAAVQTQLAIAESAAISSSYFWIGMFVVGSGLLGLTIKFSEAREKEVSLETAIATKSKSDMEPTLSLT
jgi:MFS transporter, NNP family, nitrate/nitrite transporter